MINLNNYIFEKLRINKDLKTANEILLDDVKKIIIDYLKKNNWFDHYQDDFSVTPKQDSNSRETVTICLYYPEELNSEKNITKIGVDIATRIKKELHVDWEWMLNKDNCNLIFTNDI